MLEAFDMFNVLNVRDNLGQFIHFEKRKSKGSEHFYGLLHAIRNKFQVELVHQKFDDELPSKRVVNPLGLKEFKGRWYLLACGESDDFVKSFGLDRVVDFTILKKKYAGDLNMMVKDLYADCFGIINPRDKKPEKVVVSFTAEQGKYVQTYPLHSSQKVLVDNADEFRIELYLKVTSDLVAELLTFGEEATVVAPLALKNEMKRIFKHSLEQL